MTNFQRIDILETIKKVNRQSYAIATTFVGKYGKHSLEVISVTDNEIEVYLDVWNDKLMGFDSKKIFDMRTNSGIDVVSKLLDLIEELVAELDAK